MDNFEKVPNGIFDKVESNKELFISEFKEKLEEVFPATVKDGIVDFEALLNEFGKYAEIDEKEKYNMTWVGKKDAIRKANEDIIGKTLKYVPEDSKNPNTTQNLYIEGDNLEVLKLIRNSYYGKVKMIYIDPPYNTGNDFIYNDDYSINVEEYEKLEGTRNEYGEKLVKNQKNGGRFHSTWLNMMYSRLRVAKDLLTDDGVIFMSIGEDEISNLRNMSDEIFGQVNCIGIIPRLMKTGGNKGRFFSPNIDYILIYAKNIYETGDFKGELDKKLVDKLYNKVETEGNRKGERYRPFGLYQSSLDARPNQRYYVECPDGTFAIPPGTTMPKELIDGYKVLPNKTDGCWRWSSDRYLEEKEKGNIVFVKSKNGVLITPDGKKSKWNVYTKIWLSDRQNEGQTPRNFISKFENRHSAKELKKLNITFDFAKPSSLIKYLMSLVDNTKNAIVCDFFSGSATTAHATMQFNAEDSGNRKFIMVQLPELCDEKSDAFKAGYKNICEIGKERIRRAGEKILEENKDKEGIENLDIGFKVFKVADTNIRWISDTLNNDFRLEDYRVDISEKDRLDFNPHFTDIDVVYEMMLKRQDIELTERIDNLQDIGDRTYLVGYTVLVCLEEKITEEMVRKISEIDTSLSWIVFRDSAFDDDINLKTNTMNLLRTLIKEKNPKSKNQKILWI